MEQSEVYGSARPYATLVTVDQYVWGNQWERTRAAEGVPTTAADQNKEV